MSTGFVLILAAFFSVHQYISSDTVPDGALSASERVRNYLAALNSTNWLENSNKIGIGYNPLYGSAVCYTGTCQMEGFGRSIFKLKYTQPAAGSCTPKLIPEHVQLDCVPSTSWVASTETISTLQELHQSITNKVSVNLDVLIQPVLFSYETSVETRFMIDTIVKTQTTVMQTAAQISYVKLSMFEPHMELSEEFVYVISNLPCCDYNTVIEQYIYQYIFNYFGFTFLSEILLGGIAQESIFIKNESYETMKTQGYDIKNEAKVEFYLSVGASHQYSYNQVTHNQFMSQVHEKHVTTLGGDTSLTTINQWSTTVPSNPVIIKFTIRNIFDLLNRVRFPNDSLILNKSALIARALNNYINNPVYCYNNCTGHGNCVPSSYFRFGTCSCNNGYSGFDCSISLVRPTQAATTERINKSSGTISVFHNVQYPILQLFIFSFMSLIFSFMS